MKINTIANAVLNLRIVFLDSAEEMSVTLVFLLLFTKDETIRNDLVNLSVWSESHSNELFSVKMFDFVVVIMLNIN